MKFIQFGCWNQKKCMIGNPEANPLSNVMYNLNSRITTQGDIDFLIVSGDNYYTEKRVNEKKEKEKIIHQEDLISGLNCLPKGIEVNMILGNHDLETQKEENPNLYLEEVLPEKLEIRGQCNTLNFEQAFIRNSAPNINYDFFISKYDRESQTLILMIDTSIYDDDDINHMLPCYKYMSNFIKATDGVVELRGKQEELIMRELTQQSREIRNIIISGHHPLMYYKLKINEKKPEKTKFDIIRPFPGFIELLTKIYLKVQELQQKVEYYYLCADLHLYQQGKVLIPITLGADGADGASNDVMIINQYIVGTGGTELDINPFSPEHDRISDGRIKNISDGINKDKYELTKIEKKLAMYTNYVMTPDDIAISNANYGHGFLECTLNPRPSFNFILVSSPSAQQAPISSLGGNRRKRRTKKYKNKKDSGKGSGKKSMKKRTRKLIKRRRYKY